MPPPPCRTPPPSLHSAAVTDAQWVCVTGGTGFLGSWMVKRLLEDGYSVNTTTRIDPDLDKPETFAAAIEGCIGVFHMAHPLDFAEKEEEDVKIKRVTIGLQGILRACAESKTVRRVVYTSSISAATFSTTAGPGLIDENCWTDVDFIRSLKAFAGPYIVTKTLADKAAIDFAEKLGLDLVSVLPTWVTGPFICPHMPDSVYVSMALIFGDKAHYQHVMDSSLVHVDDVARAHIHLFEYPEAKGRYLCVAVEFTIEELCDLISSRYPEYQMPSPDSWKDITPVKFSGYSTKKLEETGFKYENGLAEMFDGAIKCCKEKGLL
ncbi:hypothetical protein DH2020_002337 [Rehmannia glutinosa]|uniref:NAD-dependent epimerase/dehydratase domain-containing protein n=1 Tax=Rehmannia glutinosa TaxID=99300 RepID=A0ABR0XU08_REHGL